MSRILRVLLTVGWMLAALGCEGRAPVWVCPVADYVVYEGGGCSCDWPEGVPPPERRIVEEGTMSGLFAPPGTFPPERRVLVRVAGETHESSTWSDGSLAMYIRQPFADLRGATAQVEVGGEGRGGVALDTREEVLLGAAGERHPSFPEGAIAIEEPEETIWLRARLRSFAPVEVQHAFFFSLGAPSEWLEPTPRIDEDFELRVPGREGAALTVIALTSSGTANGCYFGSAGVCRCSAPKRAAGQCREPEPVSMPEPDAGPPGDGGVPF